MSANTRNLTQRKQTTPLLGLCRVYSYKHWLSKAAEGCWPNLQKVTLWCQWGEVQLSSLDAERAIALGHATFQKVAWAAFGRELAFNLKIHGGNLGELLSR